MTDRKPTSAEIDERRWLGEDSWAGQHIDYNCWYIAIGLILLSHAVFFIVGLIAGRYIW